MTKKKTLDDFESFAGTISSELDNNQHFEMLKKQTFIETMPITENVCASVLSVVDKGLSDGMGSPKPGAMCIEAAVNYALGLPHGDEPICVDEDLRSLKISINDAGCWQNNKSRAKGLRRLAIAQLGTNKAPFNWNKFCDHVKILIETKSKMDLPANFVTTADEITNALNSIKKGDKHIDFSDLRTSLDNLTDISYGVENINSCDFSNFLDIEEKLLNQNTIKKNEARLIEFCEDVVQILKKMKTPGSKYLYLTETTKPSKKKKAAKTVKKSVKTKAKKR